MTRQFLNVISRSTASGDLYSMNHLDTSQLFNSKSAAAISRNINEDQVLRGGTDEILELEPLPPATFTFQPFMSRLYHVIEGVPVFAPFGEDKVLCADGVGCTAAFDVRSQSFMAMPRMNTPKGPVRVTFTSIPCTEDYPLTSESDAEMEPIYQKIVKGDHAETFYIMDLTPMNPVSFEVFTFSFKGWVWRQLPRPPFFREKNFKTRRDSASLVDNGTIFISPSTTDEKVRTVGTYCYDTVTQHWDKLGDWVLPFQGRAEYVAEFGLWFGFSVDSPYHLCTVRSMYDDDHDDAPTVKDTLPDLEPPEGWHLYSHALFDLGSGRLCTVKYFNVPVGYDDFYTAIVFTGLDVASVAELEPYCRGGHSVKKFCKGD